MKDAFLISKSGRAVIIALAVAMASAVFITPFLNRVPWLIGIPILVGTLLVILGEFSEPMSFFIQKSTSRVPSKKRDLRPVRAASGG